MSKPDHEKAQERRLVEVTPHEERLLAALRAEPNRVAMWVSAGNPAKNHQELIALYVRFFQILTRHKIEYWLEYGSSLGYCRHRGLIPWEYDMDIGCTTENFKKLLDIGAQVEKEDPKYGFKYYKDPDYETAAWCMYLKSDPTILCDIAEYRVEGDLLVNAVPEWHYPPYKLDDVLPPRQVMMFGEVALIQRRAEAVLGKTEDILGQCTGEADPNSWTLNKVPWMQYDPVPFVLVHLFNPRRAEIICHPPCIDVPEAVSVVEGLRLYGSKGVPFVVRQLKAFKFDWREVRERARATGATTHAYTRTLDQVFDVDVAKCLDDWERGEMNNLSFTDSPVAGCLIPDGGVDPELAKYGISRDTLMLALSPSSMYTPFHQDPTGLENPEGAGGGWMWLQEGYKVWNLLEYDLSLDYILDAEHRRLHDPPMHELLYLHDHALWGKVYQAVCKAGDFIYFPPAMSHRVTTYERSVGLGGYILQESDHDRVANVHEAYKKHDIDPNAGIWKALPKRAKPAAGSEAALKH